VASPLEQRVADTPDAIRPCLGNKTEVMPANF